MYCMDPEEGTKATDRQTDRHTHKQRRGKEIGMGHTEKKKKKKKKKMCRAMKGRGEDVGCVSNGSFCP